MLGAFFVDKSTSHIYTTDKASKVMEGLLLPQYKDSENFKEYLSAFVKEFDLLFEQIERVYVGQMLEYAEGKQIDVIGEILDQPRSVSLPELFFGFEGAPGAGSFGTDADPKVGGVWKSSGVQHSLTPLEDNIYKRVLLAKAMLMNVDTLGYDEVYQTIFILLNRVPTTCQLRSLGTKRLDLLVDNADVTLAEVSLITYMTKYFMPMGVTFTISGI